MIGQRIGSYRVVRELGRGGMGQVFEAVNERIGSKVAIKVLRRECCWNAEMAQRFRNEARAVNIVRHAGIVRIEDDGQFADGSPYIVMELLDGESLGTRMQRGRVRGDLRLLQQVASALAAAHAKGIVHRDLKPENIMIVPDAAVPGGQRAKLLDFGIAKLAHEELPPDATQPTARLQTETGAMMGTPVYMAPEQYGQAKEVDGKADVYSLGIVLYELFAGEPPFLSANFADMAILHRTAAPPSLRRVHPPLSLELQALVQSMLAKDANERPTMAQVEQRLAALDGPTAGLVVLPRRRAWQPWLLGLGVVAVLVVGLLLRSGIFMKPHLPAAQTTSFPVTPKDAAVGAVVVNPLPVDSGAPRPPSPPQRPAEQGTSRPVSVLPSPLPPAPKASQSASGKAERTTAKPRPQHPQAPPARPPTKHANDADAVLTPRRAQPSGAPTPPPQAEEPVARPASPPPVKATAPGPPTAPAPEPPKKRTFIFDQP